MLMDFFKGTHWYAKRRLLAPESETRVHDVLDRRLGAPLGHQRWQEAQEHHQAAQRTRKKGSTQRLRLQPRRQHGGVRMRRRLHSNVGSPQGVCQYGHSRTRLSRFQQLHIEH